jgi:hypothetical protein
VATVKVHLGGHRHRTSEEENVAERRRTSR